MALSPIARAHAGALEAKVVAITYASGFALSIASRAFSCVATSAKRIVTRPSAR